MESLNTNHADFASKEQEINPATGTAYPRITATEPEQLNPRIEWTMQELSNPNTSIEDFSKLQFELSYYFEAQARLEAKQKE